MNIELSIERIVLDGIMIPPGGYAALSDSVRTELARLFQEYGPIAGHTRSQALARVEAPSIDAPAAADPVTLGRDIARAVYGGMQ